MKRFLLLQFGKWPLYVRRWALPAALVALTMTSGATRAKAQVFPPPLALAALPAAAAEDNEGRSALRVPSTLVLPSLAVKELPPRPSRKDEWMSRAERLYEDGYKLYQAGNRENARLMFDEALDLVLNSRSEPTIRSSFDKRFEELVQKIYRIDVDSQDVGESAESTRPYDKAPIDDIISLTFPVDPKLKMKVREEVGATVSQLPLEASDAVLGFVNYFSGERGRRTLIAGIRRSGKYKAMISRILDEEGIPPEFIFLAQAESGFWPRAVSYKAAGGMWQFVRETGRNYDLKQNQWVDERFDPELATRAAARHLRDLYHEFGDWYLAIAAYNCGHGNVIKAVERTGYADVWELRSRGTLPLETSNYVPIILAMTIMSKNAKNYGIDEVIPEEPLIYDSVEMTANAGLPLIADILAIPVAELKELNPALLKDVAPAGYRLHIPRGAAQTLISGLEMVPSEKRMSWRIHRVEAGDSIQTVAARYRATVNGLETANVAVAGDQLTPGSLLVVPTAPVQVVAATPAKAAGGNARYRKPVAGKAAASGNHRANSASRGASAKQPVKSAASGKTAARRPAASMARAKSRPTA